MITTTTPEIGGPAPVLPADFVAAYNEIIEAEGLPLQAWRSF